jgi:NitT/TauT family transport system ATP-binding protein
MQQRVAICRMLIADPEVLLLDEPFGALDEITREHMNVELERIFDAQGKAALFVTHNIQESVFLSDRVVVMTERPGRIAGIVQVDLPRPRDPDLVTRPEFQELVRQTRAFLNLGSGLPVAEAPQ